MTKKVEATFRRPNLLYIGDFRFEMNDALPGDKFYVQGVGGDPVTHLLVFEESRELIKVFNFNPGGAFDSTTLKGYRDLKKALES